MRSILKTIIARVLQAEARLVLRKYKPHIVAVTGSVGKTSTKDAIYEVAASGAHVRKSEKSFNSEIGLPLTVLGRPNAWSNPLLWVENIINGFLLYLFTRRYPEWLVLEVGADRPGDISSLQRWLRVDIAVITRLPEVPVHVEFFDSPEAVKQEKASLIGALKQDGALVLYADDKEVNKLRERAQAGVQVVTFGILEEADVRAKNIAIVYNEKGVPTGMQGDVSTENESGKFHVKGTIGAHAVLPILAAIGVGRAMGKTLSQSLTALAHFEPPPGRMRLLEGIKETIIIDDTYNASPAATAAALETLALVPAKRRVAVLGDMLELGKHSVEEHRKVGVVAAQSADLLLTVGFRARDIAEGALDQGFADKNILQFEAGEAAGRELQNLLKEGDCILIKGSQSMRMERIVEEVMQDPVHAKDLLVRQDAEWRRR